MRVINGIIVIYEKRVRGLRCLAQFLRIVESSIPDFHTGSCF